MININKYIVEKLHLNKNIQVDKDPSSRSQYFLDAFNQFFEDAYNIHDPNIKVFGPNVKIGTVYKNTYKYIVRIFYKDSFPSGVKWSEVKNKLKPYLEEILVYKPFDSFVEEWWFSPAQKNSVDTVIKIKK